MGIRLFVVTGAASGSASWLLSIALTHALHSLIWAAVAALLCRVRSQTWAARHSLWKVALFAPVFSALWANSASIRVERKLDPASYLREVAVSSLAGRLTPLGAAAEPSLLAASRWRMSAQAFAPGSGGRAVILLSLGAVALGLMRFFGAACIFAKRLRGRIRVTDARLLGHVERLRSGMGLRGVVVSECSNIGSPLVIGLRELCMPRALIAELNDAELDAVLAHELAHIERADGLWFAIAGLLQAVFWFNPITHWVCCKFRQSAEFACDDRAVELTRDPFSLARALVRVASSTPFARPLALAPMMARSRATLLPRLMRLTDRRSSSDGRSNRGRRSWAFAALLAFGVATGSLSVKVAQARTTQRDTKVGALHRHLRFEPEAPPASAPNAEEQSERLGALAQREQRLETQIEAAQRGSLAEQGGPPDATRALELRQELRHVRATQSWLEEQFVNEWAAWDKSRATRDTPAHVSEYRHREARQ